MTINQIQLSDAQIAAIAMHEEMHQLMASANREPLTHIVADDIVVNGGDGKTLNWGGLLAMHLDSTFELKQPQEGELYYLEDTSHVISQEQISEFLEEIVKIKSYQAKVDRIGARRVQALQNKMLRHAKKQAKRAQA